MKERSESGEGRLNYDVAYLWNKARITNFHTDVNFRVGRGESFRTYSAHKIVLAISSPVFEAMFYGSLREKSDPIEIVDIEPEVFKALLSYMYGELDIIRSILFASKVYIAADKYLVKDMMKTVTIDIFVAEMDYQQFWKLIVEDVYFHIPAVKWKCLEFFKNHSTNICHSQLFMTLSFGVLEELLQLEQRTEISEFDLLSAVVHWGMNNVGPGMEKLKNTLRSLMCYIKFTHFTELEFNSFLRRHPGLIEDDDSVLILNHIQNPAANKLPTWCCDEGDRTG